MIVITALFVWSKLAVSGLIGATTLVVLIRSVVHRRRSELARLAKYERGYFDHQRDHTRSQRKALGAMNRLSRETAWIGKRIGGYATMLGDFRSTGLRECVGWLAARDMRKSAERFSRIGKQFKAANDVLIKASEGLIDFSSGHSSVEAKRRLRKAIESMRATAAGTIVNQEAFARAARTSPKISQRYNASKTELANAVDETVVILKETVAYCDRTIARLA
jgi:hypothetical protein